ncbi:MAG: hypothetical protein STSR0009_08040 [Methanoregula sp.]
MGMFLSSEGRNPTPLTVPDDQNTRVSVVKSEENSGDFSHTGDPLRGIPARKKLRVGEGHCLFLPGGEGGSLAKIRWEGVPTPGSNEEGVGWFTGSG